MVRQGHLIAVVVVFLIGSGVVVSCGGSTAGHVGGSDGEQSTDTTNEETTAPKVGRPAAKTTQEFTGLDVEVVSPDQDYLPAGFGEGSLWATDFATCNDTGPASASAGTSGFSVDGSVGVSLVSCVLPANMLLKRLDPQSGEEEAIIQLKGFSANTVEVTFGAGSVWVSSGDYYPEPVSRRQPGDVVLRVDPETERVVDRIPVDSPTGLAFGHGSVWTASAEHGTVSRINPQTGEVAAEIEVGRGAVDIATDERSGDVWVAGLYLAEDFSGDFSEEDSEYNKLSRVNPETNHVVEEIPIEAHSHYGGGANNVAVGEGAVWVLSGDGNLLKVDPATNEIAATGSVGDSPSHLAVYGGGVWTMVKAKEIRLVRVDPQTMQIVASEDIGPIPKIGPGGLAAGGGYVWFSSEEGLARVSP